MKFFRANLFTAHLVTKLSSFLPLVLLIKTATKRRKSNISEVIQQIEIWFS